MHSSELEVKSLERKKLILIVGPTAVGKTDLSIKLAKELNGEIFSVDSMQIYKDMDIGTAKIEESEMEGIPHYMIDIVNPDEEFSVSDFRELVYKYIDEISSKGKVPIGVGGTGLYVNSLVYQLNFAEAESDEKIRDKYTELAEEHGNQYIMDKLKEIDPESAERLNLNDTKRIIRAIEIYEMTGKKMSENYSNFRKENDDFELVIIGLNRDRQKLYERINLRVDIMMENGLVDEVRDLLERGFTKDMTSMKAIGYKEVIEYIEGNMDYDEMVEILKRNSRRFAKRQLTWFRRDKRIKWFDYDEYENSEEMYSDILETIKNEIDV